MTKHVKLNLELTEWDGDGDNEKRVRHITIECYGGFERKPWTKLQHHGEPLTAAEVEGLNKVIAGFGQMAEQEQI